MKNKKSVDIRLKNIPKAEKDFNFIDNDTSNTNKVKILIYTE
jgi:hypothetical protein